MKITIRAYVYGQFAPLFTEHVEISDPTGNYIAEIDIAAVAERQATAHDLANRPHAIEIEFPAVGNSPAHFFRIGTDPRLLKIPIPLHTLDDDGLADIVKRQAKALQARWN